MRNFKSLVCAASVVLFMLITLMEMVPTFADTRMRYDRGYGYGGNYGGGYGGGWGGRPYRPPYGGYGFYGPPRPYYGRGMTVVLG